MRRLGGSRAPWWRGALDADPSKHYGHMAYGYQIRKYCDAWQYFSDAVESLLECETKTYNQLFSAKILQYRMAKFNDAFEAQMFTIIWHVVDTQRAESAQQPRDAYYWGARWATTMTSKGDKDSGTGQARRYRAFAGRDTVKHDSGGIFGRDGSIPHMMGANSSEVLSKLVKEVQELEELVRTGVLRLPVFDIKEYSSKAPFDPTPITPLEKDEVTVSPNSTVSRYFDAVKDLRDIMNPSGGRTQWGQFYRLMVEHIEGRVGVDKLDRLIEGGNVEEFVHTEREQRVAAPWVPARASNARRLLLGYSG